MPYELIVAMAAYCPVFMLLDLFLLIACFNLRAARDGWKEEALEYRRESERRVK